MTSLENNMLNQKTATLSLLRMFNPISQKFSKIKHKAIKIDESSLSICLPHLSPIPPFHGESMGASFSASNRLVRTGNHRHPSVSPILASPFSNILTGFKPEIQRKILIRRNYSKNDRLRQADPDQKSQKPIAQYHRKTITAGEHVYYGSNQRVVLGCQEKQQEISDGPIKPVFGRLALCP